MGSEAEAPSSAALPALTFTQALTRLPGEGGCGRPISSVSGPGCRWAGSPHAGLQGWVARMGGHVP